MKATERNLELLRYIIQERPNSGVTELIKLCYLIDLTSIKKNGEKISDFKYIRYTYGPFDDAIYPCLKKMVIDGVICENTSYTPSGTEYITYKSNEEQATSGIKHISKEFKVLIDEVLDVMKGHGAKALTDVAYKTKPMKKFGATLGGNEHLNEELDLSA